MGEPKAMVPPFSEIEDILKWRKLKGDPPPDIYKVIDRARLVTLVNAEIRFNMAVSKATVEFYEALGELMKGLK